MEALLVAGCVVLAAWLALVGGLLVLGRRDQARALAGFVPDCAVLCSRLARDPAVPARTKALLLFAAAYLAMPVDLVPDFIPVLGQLDDALLVAGVLRHAIRAAGADTIRAHWPGPEPSLAVVLRLT